MLSHGGFVHAITEGGRAQPCPSLCGEQGEGPLEALGDDPIDPEKLFESVTIGLIGRGVSHGVVVDGHPHAVKEMGLAPSDDAIQGTGQKLQVIVMPSRG